MLSPDNLVSKVWEAVGEIERGDGTHKHVGLCHRRAVGHMQFGIQVTYLKNNSPVLSFYMVDVSECTRICDVKTSEFQSFRTSNKIFSIRGLLPVQIVLAPTGLGRL